MENPVKEIPTVIHLLTQTTPSEQRETIATYFTQNASFTHPFCRTGSWENSRFLIWAVYRWYKILSPRIEMTVNSVAFDEANSLLYVQVSQIFRIWFIPFYKAPVNLVTVLGLYHSPNDRKYYIKSQDDLYQTDEFMRFVLPPGYALVQLLQFFSTAFCLLGAMLFWPISVIEEWAAVGKLEIESKREDHNHRPVRVIKLVDTGEHSEPLKVEHARPYTPAAIFPVSPFTGR
jgi:hypothetical protein